MRLTVKQAAALLGKSARTVRHLAQNGKLPGTRVDGRWMFDRDALVGGDLDAVAHRAPEVKWVREQVCGATLRRMRARLKSPALAGESVEERLHAELRGLLF